MTGREIEILVCEPWLSRRVLKPVLAEPSRNN
jgi:hypothetical protein